MRSRAKSILILITSVLFMSTGHAYQCDLPLETLISETENHSVYSAQNIKKYLPLDIQEVGQKEFDGLVGEITPPSYNALYLDEERRIVIQKEREKYLSGPQSCALLVHEICHHLQNVHPDREDMTNGLREAKCYLVQQEYLNSYAGNNWAKKNRPLPRGPNGLNGYEAVREFKMIMKARAATQTSDFDINEYDCYIDPDHGNQVCMRKVSE